MELVLGLAALATAISSVGGANYIKDDSNIIQEEPKTVHVTNQYDLQQADISTFDGGITSHIGGFEGIGHILPNKPAKIKNIDQEPNNNNPGGASDIGTLMASGSSWNYNNYSSKNPPSIDSATIKGAISSESDVDWYTFSLYGKARVEITLTEIPRECNYNIALYRKANRINAGVDEVELIISAAKPLTYDENISKFLDNAGVYYVKVYPAKNNEGIIGYATTTYSLTCSAEYSYQDAKAKDLKEMGAKGALWLADHDPFGLKPAARLKTKQVGYDIEDYEHPKNNKHLYNPEFPLEMDKEYKQAELFVWDHDLRNELAAILWALIGEEEGELKDAIDLYIKVQKWSAAGDIVITIVSECSPKMVSVFFSLVNVSLDIVDFMFPEGNRFQDMTDLIDYLGDMYQALVCNAMTGDEVIRIPVRFHLKHEHYDKDKVVGTGPGDWTMIRVGESDTYSISYAPIKREKHYDYDDGGKQTFDDVVIHAMDHEHQSQFMGTIYPLFDIPSCDRALNRERYYDYGCEELELNNDYSVKLNSGWYKWYSFEAPHTGQFRIRSSGDSYASLDVFNEKMFTEVSHDNNRIASAWRTAGYDVGFSYDFALNQGEKLYFRVGARTSNYSSDYIRLFPTTISLTEIPAGSIFSLDPYDFDLGPNWTDFWSYSTIDGPCHVDIDAKGTFYNEDNGYLEMRCDTYGVAPKAYLNLHFDRPIKSFTFGTYIANSYTYAALPLYVYAIDDDGDTAFTYTAESYCNDSLIPNGFECDTNTSHPVYGIAFRLDPATDTSPYHVSYQEQILGDFVVEFAD